MKNKSFNFRLGYIDLLLNAFVAILFLFSISVLMINIKTTKEPPGIKKNAELMIQIDWPSELDCDVDLWVQNPQNNVVSYQNRDVGLMHLERDDLGFRNDSISILLDSLINKTSGTNVNQEVWVLRGKDPGLYTVNVHLYACRFEGKQIVVHGLVKVPVEVSIIKLNPDYVLLKKERVIFDNNWQEITVFNFMLTDSGWPRNFTKNVTKLVKMKE